jgi:hypothetical protein
MSDALRITEQERPVRAAEPQPPQAEIWRLMREHAERGRADADAARRRLADERARLTELATGIANAQYQLGAFIAGSGAALRASGLTEQAEMIEGLHAKLAEALRAAGVALLVLDGMALEDDVREWVEVVASVPDGTVAAASVRETVVPGVVIDNEIVQRARVVLAVPEPAAALSGNLQPQGGDDE